MQGPAWRAPLGSGVRWFGAGRYVAQWRVHAKTAGSTAPVNALLEGGDNTRLMMGRTRPLCMLQLLLLGPLWMQQLLCMTRWLVLLLLMALLLLLLELLLLLLLELLLLLVPELLQLPSLLLPMVMQHGCFLIHGMHVVHRNNSVLLCLPLFLQNALLFMFGCLVPLL